MQVFGFILFLVVTYLAVAIPMYIGTYILYRLGIIESGWGQIFPVKWRK